MVDFEKGLKTYFFSHLFEEVGEVLDMIYFFVMPL